MIKKWSLVMFDRDDLALVYGKLIVALIIVDGASVGVPVWLTRLFYPPDFRLFR